MPAPARWQELPPVRVLVRPALGKIAYVHYFKLLESAGEDQQAKEVEQDAKDRAHEGKPGRESHSYFIIVFKVFIACRFS